MHFERLYADLKTLKNLPITNLLPRKIYQIYIPYNSDKNLISLSEH